MSTDNLTDPLRRAGSGSVASKLRLSSPLFLLLIISLVLSGIFGWFMLNRNPLGGEPRIVVPIKPLAEKENVTSNQSSDIRPAQEGGEKPLEELQGSDTTEQKEGKQQGKSETPPDKVIISGGKTAQTQLKKRKLPSAPIEGLFTRTPSGLLPKISQTGNTPARAYARPISFDVTAANKDKPRIAILLTGMGISPTSTGEAMRKLPGQISLAFAPYAKNLQTTVSKARNNGHEVLLQLPMEPFDYPDNDPGPHTLLANTSTQENNIRTNWLLTRFAGYTGVTNYMGAKFTASPDAIKPFLMKIKEHGLFYFEDGASQRSQTGAIGKAMGTSFSRANLILDGDQDKKTIKQQLHKLENIARDRGTAIGVGTALPITIDILSDWSKTLNEKNIVLIPISSTALGKK